MHTSPLFTLLTLLSTASAQTKSSKRGLVYVPSDKYPLDAGLWDSETSDLTWYYNYQSQPSAAFTNNSKFEFVPMLWGTSNTFLSEVTSLIESGTNVSYVLAFNEPDAVANGGSGIDAETAAQTWIKQVEPLKKLGVKLGAPAVTGAPTGFNWLRNFFTHCAGNCSADFIPVHWYGNFDGFASHIGEVNATYQNMTMWVTEYALNHVPLEESQAFYNMSAQFMDRTDYITHYSYFGSFRSDVSNVGPNAAMLTQNGDLTDIGSWYLGGTATGKVPKGAAGKKSISAGSILLVALTAIWPLL